MESSRKTVRSLLHRTLLVLACCAAPALQAQQPQDYPRQAVRLVVNYPPGGPVDIVARQLATRLAVTLKQPFVVENISGASGHIGAGTVARAQPDGHTVLLSIDAPFTSGPWFTAKMPYPVDALRPVTLLGVTGLTVAAHPSTAVNSFAELVKKGRQEELTFSTPGIGGPGHFAALLLADLTGMKINPIHYRGNAPAVLAVVSGEVQAGVLATTGLLPHVKAGKVKGLAAAGVQRSALLPDLQTVGELGYPRFTLQSMFVAMVPAKTPEPIAKVLHEAIAEAVQQPDLQKQLRGIDITPLALAGPEAAAEMAKAHAEYGRIVKATGMKPE